MKRLFDLTAAVLGIILLFPFFLLIALAIKLDSRGPVFFKGERIGKDGRVFRVLKFRTMFSDASQRGGALTHRGDPRITRVGHFLRRTKIDELPQLMNVLKGEMSLVGPRPEDPRYVDYYSTRQRDLFSVLPGITSIASIRYRHEEEFLPPESWEKAYVETILPPKLDTELNYLTTRSFGQDLLIIFATLFALVKDEARFDRWAQAITRFESFLEHYVSWAVVDVFLVVIAYLTAFYMRFLLGTPDPIALSIKAGVVVAIYLIANYFAGVYQRYWSFASARDAVVLFASSMAATSVVSLVDVLAPRSEGIALRGIWLGGFFVFALMAAARYRRRLVGGIRQFFEDFIGFTSGGGARVLVVGAGEEGQLLVWQLQNRMQGEAYQVIGLVDDDRQKQGMRIHNVRVYGDRRLIPELAANLHADLIILAIPPKKVRDPQELLTLCRATSAQIKIVPGLFDWLGHNGHAPGWQDVNDEELLQRSARQVDEAACRTLLEGRVVMVTGAAGSIGSELCRQIAAYHPRRLVLLDVNESDLYELLVELRSQATGVDLDLVLGDITNLAKMTRVFDDTRPQIVFHAAAYKHVPILEEFPQEGIRVNIQGTRVIRSLAQCFGAERFVLISSDKAVNPSNVLGMTKWVGELLVMTKQPGVDMLSTAVRFGNVLGSRGSVVPTFEKQIEMGGPITITHPDMTRYFLSLSEAVSLVIQAAAMTQGGDIFALDMGVPVRILDLAHRMIRARGLRPGQDIAVEFVGTRAGEKLTEELISPAEETCPTEHQAIFRIERRVPLNLSRLDQQLEQLVSFSLDGYHPDAIRAKLRDWVEALQTSTMPPPSHLTGQSEGDTRPAAEVPGAVPLRSGVWQTLS